LNPTTLFGELFEMRQIAAWQPESSSVPIVKAFLCNWLQPFLEDSPLAVNLLRTLVRDALPIARLAKFTTQ
jgi:hypothetical protein